MSTYEDNDQRKERKADLLRLKDLMALTDAYIRGVKRQPGDEILLLNGYQALGARLNRHITKLEEINDKEEAEYLKGLNAFAQYTHGECDRAGVSSEVERGTLPPQYAEFTVYESVWGRIRAALKRMLMAEEKVVDLTVQLDTLKGLAPQHAIAASLTVAEANRLAIIAKANAFKAEKALYDLQEQYNAKLWDSLKDK